LYVVQLYLVRIKYSTKRKPKYICYGISKYYRIMQAQVFHYLHNVRVGNVFGTRPCNAHQSFSR